MYDFLRRVQLACAPLICLLACGGDERNCLAPSCQSLAVIEFDPPISGSSFVFHFGDEVWNCGIDSRPNCNGPLALTVENGTLREVTWLTPEAGPFQFMAEADGATIVDRMLQYRPTGTYDRCGTTCYDPVRLTVP